MHCGFGDCELDTERHALRRRGQPVSLEPKALQVLVYLIQRHGHAVTTHELCQEFYPGPSDAYKEYALRNCLYKIRQAVGDAGTPGRVIETLRGYGYRFAAPVTLRRDTEDRLPDPPPPSPRLSGQRPLTVLCCTLVVPPRLEHLDADDFQTILQPFYTACEQAMQPFAGTIAHYASDELLVYFGYPSAQEDAPQRAVRAGLALREAI